MRKTINHIYLIILLALLSSVAPIATDTYIPSIPDMADFFNVNIEKVELTLSIFLIGFAIGQIFGGPISDRIGRRKSSIIGLLGFAFFSFVMIFSTDVYHLWIFRFIEAFFGGLVIVNANAVLRDKFQGKEAAKVLSLMGTIGGLAPLLAPAIGAFIIHFFSWKAVFLFLTIYSLVIAFLIFKDLEESYTYVKQSIYESYKTVLSNKTAMKAMLTLALSFSGFFIFITKSSFILIDYYNVSTDHFPFFFGVNFILLIGMVRVNLWLLKKYEALTLAKVGIIIQIILGIIWILTANTDNIAITMILMAGYMSMLAFVLGNCMALALEHFKKNAGLASGVIGVLQFGLGSIVSSIVLLFNSTTLLPIGIAITIIPIISYFIIRTYK
ncbi:Bcr/CflA family drug resistance efflux transporter [Malaciobacter pacificus]|uniref:Drug resistance transporter, Bcr/CflA family n=1 Tax=Malaciobacter pacificus TaxID=1080223 RepID=A0A5C2H9N4_9BACT|nr:multidrug effflux MFS transporter [Malaciobacter pacificus]QEP35621.1 drug resistance transporter, Bcr/CflA family [Malaciobacter pacificus]GGD46215.1 Bcr/CflA family drug resistance efflux transporter [Malaciobacter pacificus]